MPDWEEINRQDDQHALWSRGYGIYEEPFGVPNRDSPEYAEYWKRYIKPDIDARWERLKHG